MPRRGGKEGSSSVRSLYRAKQLESLPQVIINLAEQTHRSILPESDPKLYRAGQCIDICRISFPINQLSKPSSKRLLLRP